MTRMAILLRRMALPSLVASACCLTAAAAPITFTWDPSKSIPALAGGASFTADSIDTKTYLSSVVETNGVSVFKQILQVTGFELNGQPIGVPGLNSGYGLYFDIAGISQMNGGPATYSQLNISLVADPGNNNGVLSATTAGGLAFANGTSGDFVLGSGTLVSATLGLDPAGVRHANYVETFASAAGQAAFFGALSPLLNVALTTPGANFSAAPQLDGSTIISVNGGLGQETFVATPEPASLALLGSGLLAMSFIGRRRLKMRRLKTRRLPLA